MSLDLVNLTQTTARLASQVSNDNVVQSNILKLQKLTVSIQEERQKLQDEKDKMRKMKKKMDEEKEQWKIEKTNMQNQKEMIRHQMLKSKSLQSMATEANLEQRKNQRELQKRLDKIQQELTATKRKLMAEQFDNIHIYIHTLCR